MSWGYVAVAAGTVISSAVSSKSASKSSKSASKAAASELEFAQQQYQDWVDVFGDLQTNLSDYYTNLTPDFQETQMLQSFEQEKELALKQLEADFAQRGIDTSGVANDARTDIAFASAAERARIRAEAPIKTAETQREFLQIGLGQNPADNVQSTLANRARQLSNSAAASEAAAGRAVGAAVDTTFDALTKILDDRSESPGNVGAPVGNPNSTEAARTV